LILKLRRKPPNRLFVVEVPILKRSGKGGSSEALARLLRHRRLDEAALSVLPRIRAEANWGARRQKVANVQSGKLGRDRLSCRKNRGISSRRLAFSTHCRRAVHFRLLFPWRLVLKAKARKELCAFNDTK
jgi:hypothetical protein